MIPPGRIASLLGLMLSLTLLPAEAQSTAPPPSASAAATDHFEKALKLRGDRQWDKALAEVNAALKIDPANARFLVVRGDIYVKKMLLKEAEADFTTAAKLKPDDAIPAYDLAEVNFMQKEYGDARAIFAVVVKDPRLGELAKFKIFLCDLMGESLDKAEEELAEFNREGIGASYYYANAAWDLYHHRLEEARPWLNSAARIYSKEKNDLYTSTLIDLGFLANPEK